MVVDLLMQKEDFIVTYVMAFPDSSYDQTLFFLFHGKLDNYILAFNKSTSEYKVDMLRRVGTVAFYNTCIELIKRSFFVTSDIQNVMGVLYAKVDIAFKNQLNFMNKFRGGAKKQPWSLYNMFVSKHLRAGKTLAEAAKLWTLDKQKKQT